MRRRDGYLAGALALAALWVASRVVAAVPFAPLSLAGRLIRLAPGDAATWAIDHLGENAIRLLAVGVTVGILALAGEVRRRTAGAAPLLLFVVLAAAGLAAPVGGQVIGALAGAAGAALIYGLTLAWLGAVSSAPDPERRRTVLWLGSAATALVLTGTGLDRLLAATRGPDRRVRLRAAEAGAATAAPAASLPAIDGLSGPLTSVRDHYVVDIDLVDPVVEAETWRLEVGGLVGRPLSVGFDELQARFTVVEDVSVLTCVSNVVGGPLVGNSRWTGVRLREVLGAAGVKPGAVDVVFTCADSYTVSVPIARAMDPDTLLTVAQNGQPLTQAHGFPCRVRIPALYGMMNAKWLQTVEVVADDHKGYWARRGWSDVGEVRTQSRIDTPRSARAGVPTWIAGVAWAGERGLSRVEVSVDAGRTWQPARLEPPLSPTAWVRWAVPWTPPAAGTFRLVCRATDGRGRPQDAKERPPHPSGATGYPDIDVQVA